MKKEWKKGFRQCMKCDRIVKVGQYIKVENPPEYFGEPYSWSHKLEIVCKLGYFHCPGDKCNHKVFNSMFSACVPKSGWIMRVTNKKESLLV